MGDPGGLISQSAVALIPGPGFVELHEGEGESLVSKIMRLPMQESGYGDFVSVYKAGCKGSLQVVSCY